MLRKTCRLLQVFFVLGMTVFFVSCTTTKMYDGPELPSSRVAIIESANLSVTIESLDNRPAPASRIAVLPEQHEVEMSFYDRMPGDWTYWSIYNTVFSFHAEAGHAYSIGWRASPDNYSTYIVVLTDRTTGARVPYTSHTPPQPMGMYNESGYPVR